MATEQTSNSHPTEQLGKGDLTAVGIESSSKSQMRIHWWHWVIGAGLIILLTYLSPRGKSLEFANLTEGSISQRKTIAPFDFEILKSLDELKKERQDAAGNILPVLATVDSVDVIYIRELHNFAVESKNILSKLPSTVLIAVADTQHFLSLNDSLKVSQSKEELFNLYGFRLADDTWRFLIGLYNLDQHNQTGIYLRFFEFYLSGILGNIFKQGIINIPKEKLSHPSEKVIIQRAIEETPAELRRLLTATEALNRISYQLKEKLRNGRFPSGAVSAAYEMIQPFVVANRIYNSAETERRRQVAIAKVPLAKGFVKKDELIIGANIRVTKEHLDRLNSLAIKRAEMEKERGGLRALTQISGHFLIATIIIFLLGVFIALIRNEIWHQWKLVLLIALVLGLIHVFQVLVPVKYDLSRFMFPIAVGAMLIAILVDRYVALAGVVAMALLAGVLRGNDFPVVLISVMIGSMALFAVKKVQTRGDVMRSGLYLIALYIPLVVTLHFVHFTSGEPLLTDLAIATANAILSPTLVLGLVIICENLFGITTDLSLLELVDLNRPLLRELALKSPGTYHHSIMVGSLAESAARDIGANTLLTRAGAYYHDIGKMPNREYFIENQETGSQNIHDLIAPDKSAKIVIGHVQQGLELAEKYHLPPQVTAFISEHHGSSQLSFFYAKAVKERGDDVDEALYHYPGPNPQSKETGIIMLADTVEAATRSMGKITHQEVQETVDKLIRMRLAEGELDECPLTLREIGKIKNAFKQALTGIYHQRIAYPGQEDEKPASEKTPKGLNVNNRR
ncbi:MAG: HDIG domain-containing protein [Candidatus Hatepunaea meridiana]|nr:HDIG domain-containing protein [Candidatus Hatepunaea meridiana]